MKKFHSCFVVDVSVGNVITLTDSAHSQWHIDAKDEKAVAGFRTWLKDVFMKGVAQTLTVFEYENRGIDPDFDFYITSFCGLQSEKTING